MLSMNSPFLPFWKRQMSFPVVHSEMWDHEVRETLREALQKQNKRKISFHLHSHNPFLQEQCDTLNLSKALRGVSLQGQTADWIHQPNLTLMS